MALYCLNANALSMSVSLHCQSLSRDGWRCMQCNRRVGIRTWGEGGDADEEELLVGDPPVAAGLPPLHRAPGATLRHRRRHQQRRFLAAHLDAFFCFRSSPGLLALLKNQHTTHCHTDTEAAVISRWSCTSPLRCHSSRYTVPVYIAVRVLCSIPTTFRSIYCTMPS